MLPKQKSFLDELAALFRKYSIDFVCCEDNYLKFLSNGCEFFFESYDYNHGESEFENVVSTEDYSPEDPPEVYSGEENFDD